MIRVITEDLGYRELDRLGDFLHACATNHKYYDNINLWIELVYECIDIGYDKYYDEGYMTNELGLKCYQSDFD